MADPGWGIWDKCPPPPPPPPHLVKEPATLLSKVLAKLCMSGQDQFSYKTHENIHILIAFITNSPETKANKGKLAVKLSTSTFMRTKRL